MGLFPDSEDILSPSLFYHWNSCLNAKMWSSNKYGRQLFWSFSITVDGVQLFRLAGIVP